MSTGNRGLINNVVSALENAQHSEGGASYSAAESLGDKLFGPTAESESRNAEVIAPYASTEPTTVGRRSKAPGGQDPFHASSYNPDEQA